MATNLSDPIFHDENAARAHFEAIRWPNGRTCPHCGTIGNSTLMTGKTTRSGLYKCKDCRKPFSATMGTVYERSHIPLHKWLHATHMIVSSKKGISAHQLFRDLGFGSYKTAWFMAHRIREAMRDDCPAPMGSTGGAVEVDETYIGRKKGMPVKGAYHHKMAVLGLVDRTDGRIRLIHVDKASGSLIHPIVLASIAREARLMTDESTICSKIGREFAEHGTVHHYNKEYVRGDITTNTIEGAFSIFKRGMRGIYQHCAEKHLHRYLVEFEFRYTHRAKVGVDDTARATLALAGTVGKRLTYQQADSRAVH